MASVREMPAPIRRRRPPRALYEHGSNRTSKSTKPSTPASSGLSVRGDLWAEPVETDPAFQIEGALLDRKAAAISSGVPVAVRLSQRLSTASSCVASTAATISEGTVPKRA